MMRRLIVLAAACAIPGALLAQDTTPAPAPAATAEAPVKVKKFCRREETTGSIMSTRTCHTQDEWTRIDEANRRAAEGFASSRRTSGQTPGN